MSLRVSRPAADTAALMTGRVIGGAVAIITLRLAASRYGPVGWGQVVTAMALAGLVTAVVDGGLFTLARRELARPDADKGPLLGALLARLLIGLVAAPLLLVLVWHLYPGSPGIRYGVAALTPSIVLDGLRQAVQAIYLGRGRARRWSAFDAVSSLPPLVAAVLVVVRHLGPVAFLAASTAGELAVTGIALAFAWRLLPTKRSPIGPAVRCLVSSAAPLAAVVAINVVYFWVDSVLLSLMRPSADVGLYGVAYKITSFVMAIPSFFMLALLPSVMRASPDERRSVATRSIHQMATISIPITIGVAVISRPVVQLLAGRRFAGAAGPLSILMVAAALSFLTAVFGNLLVSEDRQRELLPFTALVAATNLALNLALIPHMGASGAAIAMAASEAVALAGSWRVYRRAHPEVPGPPALWRPALLAGAMTVLGIGLSMGPRFPGVLAFAWPLTAVGAGWLVMGTRLGAMPWHYCERESA